MLAWLISLALVPSSTWSQLEASPSGAVVVASDLEVRLSTDQGKTFRGTLFGVDRVDSVALTDDGTLYVARHGRLGVRAPDGAERWSRLPAETTYLLVANGAYVLWLGVTDPEADESWWASADGGATFTQRPEWKTGTNANTAALTPAGRVHLLLGWEAPCGGGYQERYVGRISDHELRSTGWPLDSPVDYFPTTRGWVYVPDDCDEFNRYVLCAVSPRGVVSRLAVPFDDEDYGPMYAAEDGARTWLLHHGQLTRAAGRLARVVSTAGPLDARGLAATSGTRWVITEAGLIMAFTDGRWIVKTP